MHSVCCGSINVYLPDKLAAEVKESRTESLRSDARRRGDEPSLNVRPTPGSQRSRPRLLDEVVPHDRALEALNAARDEVPTRHGWRSPSTPRRSWTSRWVTNWVAPSAGGSQATLCMHQPISIRGSLRSGAGCDARRRHQGPRRRVDAVRHGRCIRSSGTVSSDLLVDSGPDVISYGSVGCLCASSWRSRCASADHHRPLLAETCRCGRRRRVTSAGAQAVPLACMPLR